MTYMNDAARQLALLSARADLLEAQQVLRAERDRLEAPGRVRARMREQLSAVTASADEARRAGRTAELRALPNLAAAEALAATRRTTR